MSRLFVTLSHKTQATTMRSSHNTTVTPNQLTGGFDWSIPEPIRFRNTTVSADQCPYFGSKMSAIFTVLKYYKKVSQEYNFNTSIAKLKTCVTCSSRNEKGTVFRYYDIKVWSQVVKKHKLANLLTLRDGQSHRYLPCYFINTDKSQTELNCCHLQLT